MPLPALLAGISSGISIYGGLRNMFGGYSEERRRQDELRRQRLLDQAQQAGWDRRYGRTLDELGDYYSGTEGGAGRASRMDTELRLAEPGLRAGSSDMAGAATGARAGLSRSLARRGVSGPAANASLTELETGLADTARRRVLAGQAGARQERMQWAGQAGQRPTGLSSELERGYAMNPVQADLSGLQTGLQELATLSEPPATTTQQPNIPSSPGSAPAYGSPAWYGGGSTSAAPAPSTPSVPAPTGGFRVGPLATGGMQGAWDGANIPTQQDLEIQELRRLGWTDAQIQARLRSRRLLGVS